MNISLPGVLVGSSVGTHHTPSAGCHPYAAAAYLGSGAGLQGYSCHGCKATLVAYLVAGTAAECWNPAEADCLADPGSWASETACRIAVAEGSRHRDRGRSEGRGGSC